MTLESKRLQPIEKFTNTGQKLIRHSRIPVLTKYESVEEVKRVSQDLLPPRFLHKMNEISLIK